MFKFRIIYAKFVEKVIVICFNPSLAEPVTLNKIFSIRQKSFAAQALLMRWQWVLQDHGQYDPKNQLKIP